MERRRATRYPKRAPVMLYVSGTETRLTGYMTNVSVGGAYVQTNRVLAPRTRLRVQIGDGASSWAVEAVVASKKEVLSGMLSIEQPGMGVRFLRPEELFEELVPRPVAPKPAAVPSGSEPVPVDLTQVGKFQEVWARDVRAGGLFVTTDRIVEMHSLVRLLVALPGVLLPITVDARVVMLAPSGFAVQFVDPDAVRRTFADVAARWT